MKTFTAAMALLLNACTSNEVCGWSPSPVRAEVVACYSGPSPQMCMKALGYKWQCKPNTDIGGAQ